MMASVMSSSIFTTVAWANSPPPGTQITNQAFGNFNGPDDLGNTPPTVVESNVVDATAIAPLACTLGRGTPDALVAAYISDEARGNNATTRAATDAFDDDWRTAAGLPQTGTVEPWFGAAQALSTNEPNLFTYQIDGNNIDVGVALVNMDTPGDCDGTVHGGAGPTLDDDNVLQDNAPRPASLYDAALGSADGHPALWDESAGSSSNPNGVLFTFAEPVSAFGAWFGDVETRTDGNGTPAYLRLLDGNGDQIGADIAIAPNNLIESSGTTPIDQADCGTSATDRGCGNKSTRWIGFVDNAAAPRIAQMLLIVGDDDDGGNGASEHISFIGANIIVVSDPAVLLVKRITAINGETNRTLAGGQNLSDYYDEQDTNISSHPYDDNVITVADPVDPGDPPKDTDQWPTPLSTFLAGGINGGDVVPNDEIEYTIYYLSTGDTTAHDVLFCDYVPEFTRFIPNAYSGNSQASGGITGADLGIAVSRNGVITHHTSAQDGDNAVYFEPGADPAVSFPGIDCDGNPATPNSNPNGAVVVDLGDIINASDAANLDEAYGYVRFWVRVK
ncbi:MAG: hypothetical protein AAGF01_09145 [Cyanobacteria bacterium P01_G01_bin.38]